MARPMLPPEGVSGCEYEIGWLRGVAAAETERAASLMYDRRERKGERTGSRREPPQDEREVIHIVLF